MIISKDAEERCLNRVPLNLSRNFASASLRLCHRNIASRTHTYTDQVLFINQFVFLLLVTQRLQSGSRSSDTEIKRLRICIICKKIGEYHLYYKVCVLWFLVRVHRAFSNILHFNDEIPLLKIWCISSNHLLHCSRRRMEWNGILSNPRRVFAEVAVTCIIIIVIIIIIIAFARIAIART